MPDVGSETIEIRTRDGWALRADVHEPAADPVGVAVLSHALMARRSEFDRPRGAGLLGVLVGRGWRVVTFDFRGHGDSQPVSRRSPKSAGAASYGYDDLVTQDLPAVYEFSKSREGRAGKVVLVGHSLGGHVGLAAQATGAVAFDAIALVGANVWLRELEPSRARWLAKRALLRAIALVCRRAGRFPARALRIGSDDTSREFVEDFERFARTGKWTSADGKVDYWAALDRVRVPVLQMLSDGDRVECVPECGVRFAARCGGGHEIIRIAIGDDGGPAPDHMGMVTSGRAASAWRKVEAWMRRRSAEGAGAT